MFHQTVLAQSRLPFSPKFEVLWIWHRCPFLKFHLKVGVISLHWTWYDQVQRLTSSMSSLHKGDLHTFTSTMIVTMHNFNVPTWNWCWRWCFVHKLWVLLNLLTEINKNWIAFERTFMFSLNVNISFEARVSFECLGSTHSPDPRASAEAARQSLAAILSPPMIRHPTNGQKSQRFEQWSKHQINIYIYICAMVKSRYIGDGHPTFNWNPYNGYINPDDHPLLYGNIWSLDPSTYIYIYIERYIYI